VTDTRFPTHISLVPVAALTLLLLLASACTPKFDLQALDPESIPAEIRDGVILSSFATGLVWRDYHEESGWSVYAYTFEICSVEGKTATGFHVNVFTTDSGYGGGADFSGTFMGTGGGGTGRRDDGSLFYHFDAIGYALDPRAAKVVGVTSTGRTVEGRVVNGFWGLLVPDAEREERWTSVKALRADGRVLFQYFDGKAWHRR